MGIASTASSASVGSLPAWRCLARSGVAATIDANSTGELPVGQFKLPGGILGANGVLRVTTIWTVTNNGNTKTARVRLGGMGGTAFTFAFSGQVSIVSVFNIHARGAQNSQLCSSGLEGSAASANQSATVDFTQDQQIIITGQKNTGSDTMTLEGWSADILSDGT